MRKEYIGLNSTVEFLIKEDNEICKIIVVDTKNGNANAEVSKNSPLGRALFGFKVGDINHVDCEDSYHIEILKIENSVFEDPRLYGENKITTNNEKLKDIDVSGKVYETSISGYADYLYDRNYKAFGESGSNSTVIQYSSAIVKILEKEGISFDVLVDNIGGFVSKYDVGGKCAEYGETGHGTWRNALKRLKEFTDYQKSL